MNDLPNVSTASSSASRTASACAVLVLDPTGRVTAANTSARALWQTGENELVGDSLATLFAFEVMSNDPEFLEAQWDVLLATALDFDTPLTAQPREGAPCDVRLRLEKILGAQAGYIATVQPPVPAAPAATAPSDDRAAALQLFVDKSTAGFFDLQFKSGRVRFSPTWKKIVGYTDAELPDTVETWHKLIHPDDSSATPDKLGKKATAGARAFSLEFRMKHRLGHWVWIQCVGLQVINSAGELERVTGFHFDITERKQVEEESLANDVRLQDLSGPGPLAAFELDFEREIFWYSPAFEKLLGHDDGDLARDPAVFAAALPPEEAAAGLQAWWLARAPGQNSFVEAVRLRAKDGRPVPVLLGAYRSVTRKRELTRVVGFATSLPTNLSAATEGQGALPVAMVAEAFGTLAESVLIVDAQHKIIFANANAVRLLQLPVEEITGRQVNDVFRLINRQNRRPSEGPVERVFASNNPLPLLSDDFLAGAREGDAVTPIVWTARAATGPDGKPCGVVVVFRNPEEMTLTPEELVRANRFETLGQLASGIAHDYNNLLTTILGAVTLAKDAKDYTALGDAEKACDTAKGLSKQLLAFAKGGAGTRIVVPSKPILEDSITIAATGSSAEVSLDVPEGVDPVEVDRGPILQVFQNLIVNALQAMPPAPHRPRLALAARNVTLPENPDSSLPAGDYVEFEVRDNGSGIKPEYVKKIFDPFFTTKKHGTGLGLATVRSVVQKHGGSIALDTAVGVGTTFTIYLPKASRPVAAPVRRAPSLPYGERRVLFMDDDPKILSLTSSMLTGLGYKFDLAKNGEEAIKLYRNSVNVNHPYAVVIMDITVVGGMGGEECFKHLKELDPNVRAVVSTGYDNDDMNNAYREMGFLGVLPKPYRAKDLGNTLKQVMG